jgi:outer membrane receptor protein involved in Fe transport
VDPSASFDVRFAGVHGVVEETNGDPISNGRTETDNTSVHAEYNQAFDSGLRFKLGYYFETFTLKILNHPLAVRGKDIDLDRSTHAVHASARYPLLSCWDLTAGGGFKEDRLDFERNLPMSDDQEIFHLNLGSDLRLFDQVFLNGGLELEHDLFAGWDLSPSAGAVYRFLPEHSLRFSYRVGRRQPNFSETRTAFAIPNPLPPPPTLPSSRSWASWSTSSFTSTS